MSIKIDPTIFRDYDIRGVYPSQISEPVFEVIGKALATYLKVPNIAVGHDCRQSSPALFEALTGGIRSMGTDVVNLGQISTEIHYFASGKFKYPANVIVSASHNPPQYNGLKIVTEGVVPLSGEYGLPQIKSLSISQNFAPSKRKGDISEASVIDEWISHALTFIDPSKFIPLKVVVDGGNGMGGISWVRMIDKIPVKFIAMNFEPDGTFPNHLPDPSRMENLKSLKEKIISEKAAVGFAIDGDADRLFVMDEKGNLLSGTTTTAILADMLLAKRGPSPVLYNAVCGRIVGETIRKYGGTPVRVRVGHSFIKRAMKDYKAIFAGEHSGHYYFDKNFNADSSLIAGLLILQYVSAKNLPVSEIAKEYQKYESSGEINFRLAETSSAIEAVAGRFKDAQSSDRIDGLSVFYPTYWFNLRSSKTEPLLRLNLEADNQMLLSEKLREVSDVIMSLGGERQ